MRPFFLGAAGALLVLSAALPVSRAGAAQTGHVVGYIGCSNSLDSVNGYAATPGKQLMWPGYNTNGGRIDLWAQSDSPYWLAFGQMVLQQGPPKAVWVQLCEDLLRQRDTFTEVQSMFANLRHHAPGATYYVSAINIYNPLAGLCSFMGQQGQGETDTTNWAGQAAKTGLAKQGPQMGPLTASLVVSDGCHPNQAGSTLLGKELHAFFDNLALP
jgi:hypothetical protein